MAQVEMKKHAPAGTIVINRPERRNALTRQTIAELRQAFDDFHTERSVKAVILTGAGSAFCAGMDLAEMRDTAESDDAEAQWQSDSNQYRDLLEMMLRYPKPIIAAIGGPAVAGGAGLVLAADITLATASAKFGLPEPRRGIVAGMVSPLLVFRAGGAAAANLLLTARLVEAEEAHRLGIYHEIVSEGVIWARAVEVAGECADCAPEALQLTKKMLNENIGEHLGTLLAVGAAVSATARTTEAAEEGLAAFLEKRDPVWP